MKRLHVLSDDFASPNGFALLLPLVAHRRLIADAGIALRIFAAPAAELTDCDVLVVDSKVFRNAWGSGRRNEAIDTISDWARRTAVLFFDTTDSTGWVNAAVLPVVRRYYKNQVLKDRSLYTRPLYGGRLHTDYCHRALGVADDVPDPQWPALGPEQARAIRVSWNSGLADYSFGGLYRSRLYRRLRWPFLLAPPHRYVPPSADRPLEVSCRISTTYQRATVAWQRLEARRLLADRAATARVSRYRYFDEMEKSRIVVSPFGFGEINYRDYETFLSGALLMKPHMAHMETWPDFFRDGETILSHDWNLSDLLPRLEEALAGYGRFVEIARHGQDTYRRFVSAREGHEAFASRVSDIVADAAAASGTR